MSFPDTEEQAGAGFTLLQLWHMLRAHLWLSVGAFVVMVAMAFFAIKSLPKSYSSTATLIVNTDNTDPLAGRNSVGTGTYFSTQVELIYNDVMLQPVIDRLKLQDDVRFTGEESTGEVASDPKALNDSLLNSLRGAVNVEPGEGSQLLYISATARDPTLAADIANAVSEEYLRKTSQRANAPAIEREARYKAQLAELKDKVSVAQAAVADYRRRYGIGMADLKDGPGGEQESNKLADLQGQLLTAQNARRLLETRRIDGRADSTDVLEAPEALQLRARLGELEGEMGQARATLGRNHPRIVELNSEIEATRTALQAAVRARYDSSALQLARARELEAKYQTAVAEERNRLMERSGVQEEGSKLLQAQRLAEDAYAGALRGLNEVQFASQGNYQDVALVSRAEPPTTAVKSNKRKLFAMALLAIFALAVGGPFAYELLFDRRIRCRDDLERGFRIVTLAQLGRMTPARAA